MFRKLFGPWISACRTGAAAWLLPVMAIFCLAGCGEQRAAPVQVDLARSILIEVLEHWKAGGTVDELRARTPEIVVQEALWTRGRTLLAFQLLEEGRAEDANWYCEVELRLQSTDESEPEQRKVTYVVGTDPMLTVFHAVL